MHEKFGFHQAKFDLDFFKHRLRFLHEELKEIEDSAETGKAEGIVDGLIDLIVVAVGTLDLGQVDSQMAWDRVHFANMSKERGTNPSRHGAGTFDLIKPPGWKAPEHGDNVGIFPEILDELFEKAFKQNGRIELVNNLNARAYLNLDGINNISPIRLEFIELEPLSKILKEVKELFTKKGNDYNNTFKRAEYYHRGIDDIVFMLRTKVMRIMSVLDLIRDGKSQNFESIEDSLKDTISYATFGIAYMRGQLDGQLPNRDIFNRVTVDVEPIYPEIS